MKAVIHINGHDIDARSGEKINSTETPAPAAPKAHHTPTHNPKPALVHHVSHKSTTLLRSSLKKPKILSDIRHTPIADMLTPMVKTRPLATHTRQSPKVTHFSKVEPRMIDVSTPDPVLSFPDSPPPIAHHIRQSKVEAHIKRQLAAATAHHAKPHKKHLSRSTKRRKTSSMAAGFAALVLIAGFVVYQSMPGLSLNIASKRAGFSAMLPKYTPGGFKLEGPVEYGQGRVVLSFSSNTDDRVYEIEQKPSLLTNDELKEQIADQTSGKFQAFNEGGQAIFISADQATWTKDGVVFSLKGDSGLSSSQIASIASSL